MEELVDLHEEAGKENEQTLANLSPAEEATSKDEVEIEKSKNTQYKTKSDLNAWKKFCESLKESRAIENLPANELDLLSPNFSSPFVKKMAVSMSRVPRSVCCGQTQ